MESIHKFGESMRDLLAIITCHFLRILLRLMGRNGGTTPGEIALKISPNVLKRLRYPSIYIAVTGTNGKTSVTGMIRTVFEKAGYRVVSNIHGDNLIFGVASAVLAKTRLNRRVKGDAVILELDEMTFAKKIEHLRPTDIVITNFFRDQLDRCGEMASIVGAVRNAVGTLDGSHVRVFVNADDPSLSGFDGLTYGLAENRFSIKNSGNVEAAEGRFCPKCSRRLTYKFYQYSHIGDYHCEDCGFSRRTPDFEGRIGEADDLLFRSRAESERERERKEENFGNRHGGLYHYYNELAVIAVAKTYGIENAHILDALNSYEKGIGRMEQIGDILLNLVKNPTGLNQVLTHLKNIRHNKDAVSQDISFQNTSHSHASRESVSRQSTPIQSTSVQSTAVQPASQAIQKKILFVLNDNRVDGKDVSWIWDADLRGFSTKHIICSGTRAYDMALRFKYEDDGFEIEVIPDIKQAVHELKKTGGYALTTYSALVQVRQAILD